MTPPKRAISTIKDIYLFIVIFEDGTEKLMILRQNGEPLPMVCADRAMVETFRQYAEHIISEYNKDSYKVRYVVRHFRPSGMPVDPMGMI